MSLSSAERIVLDIIGEWQQENPDQFGPDLVDLESDMEVLAAHGVANMNGVEGLLIDMEFKGLLVSQRFAGSGWSGAKRWRLAGLLERLAHEADGP